MGLFNNVCTLSCKNSKVTVFLEIQVFPVFHIDLVTEFEIWKLSNVFVCIFLVPFWDDGKFH